MKPLLYILLLVTRISAAQQPAIDFNLISFKGLPFSIPKASILETFGQTQQVETAYECGFYAGDQPGAPYYQLVYDGFKYIGSDKEDFILEKVYFDSKGQTVLIYGNKPMSGTTTKEDFIVLFGEGTKDNFVKDKEDEAILLRSTNGDDGALFTFKNGMLISFEYWSPC